MSKGSLDRAWVLHATVLSATGGMGQAAAVAYKTMASLLAEKGGKPTAEPSAQPSSAFVAQDRPDKGQADCLWNHQLILQPRRVISPAIN